MAKIIKQLKEEVITQKVIGFVCDRCEKDILKQSLRTDDFEINYKFGYGTEHDGTSIVAAICDDCLYEIVKKEIPHAVIKEGI